MHRKKALQLTGLFIVLMYLSFAAFLTVFQKNYLFFPHKNTAPPPPSVSEVFFPTSDGLTLHGWEMTNHPESPTVLFFHGNGGNISNRLAQLDILEDLKLNALLFDYREYGNSEGEITSEEDLYLDGEAAWDFLTQSVPESEIIVWGRSIGSSIALETALHHEPQNVILESSFFSMDKTAKDQYWYLPVKTLLNYHFRNDLKIQNLTSDLLLIHSRDDEFIPFYDSQALLELANEPKSFLEIRGSHNDGFLVSHDEYVAGIREFLGL
jgi:hypothetical protein